MNKLKKSRFFSLGRKWVFTLALFVLVFAAASVVKIHGASLDVSPPTTGEAATIEGRTLSGWIWGGSEDGSIGGSMGSVDGNETGVGWINVNCASKVDTDGDKIPDAPLKVCDGGINKFKSCNGPGSSTCPAANCVDACGITDYKVTIGADGVLHGSGWSENLGWIDFSGKDCGAAVLPAGCVRGVSSTKNSDGTESISGCACATGIAKDPSRGGWDGWIKMKGDMYGVAVDGSGQLSGYGWNGETPSPLSGLGAMDFSGVSTESTMFLKIYPNPRDLRVENNPDKLFAKVTKGSEDGDPVDGKEVIFTINPGGSSRISIDGLDKCKTGAEGTGECSIKVKALDFVDDASATISGACDGCTPKSATVNIIHTPICAVSCDDSITVPPDGLWNYSYNCSVSGESGCASLFSCSHSSGSSKIHVQTGNKGPDFTCKVMADTNARYDTAVSTASAGTGPNSSDDTNINVKVRGWIETNP